MLYGPAEVFGRSIRGQRFPALEDMAHGVLREGMRRFEARGVERILGAKKIRMIVDEMLDLFLPRGPEPICLVLAAVFVQRVNQVGDHQLVIRASFVRGPFHDFEGHSEKRFGGAEGTLEVAVFVEVMSH